MNFENFVLLNFVLTVGIAFVMYRQHVIGVFRREREMEQVHQEIRNTMEYVNGRLDNLENRIDQQVYDLYRELNTLHNPKKNSKGLSKEIPF